MDLKKGIFPAFLLVFCAVSAACVTIGDFGKPVTACIPGNQCDSGCQIQTGQACCNGQVINTTFDDCCNTRIIARASTICCNGVQYSRQDHECINGTARKKEVDYSNVPTIDSSLGSSIESVMRGSSSHDDFRGWDPEKYPGPKPR